MEKNSTYVLIVMAILIVLSIALGEPECAILWAVIACIALLPKPK